MRSRVSLNPLRVCFATLSMAFMVASALGVTAWAPQTLAGASLAVVGGVVVAAVLFSAWEWAFHRYLYHRDLGPTFRPMYLAHHRDHHRVHYPPDRFTASVAEQGARGSHPSVWSAVASNWLGRPVNVSDQVVYPVFGIVVVGGSGYWVTGRAAFAFGVLVGGVVLVLLFARVHETIHHPGLNPRLERQPWFPFLARHHYVHHLDTEANANFLIPLADWLMGTLRVPQRSAIAERAGTSSPQTRAGAA